MSSIRSFKENKPFDHFIMLPVSGNERQPPYQRGRGNQRIFFFQGRLLSAEVGTETGNSVIEWNDSVSFECQEDGLSLGFSQPPLGQQLLLRHHGIIDLEALALQNRAEEAGIEVVNEDVRIDQELDFCHARISSRKASSERLRDPLRISRTYATLSSTSEWP